MRRIWHLVLAVPAMLAGCGPATPPAPGARPAPPFSTALNLKQVMEWVIDPAADVVWDSVKSIMTMSGTREIAPKTDAEWDAVRTGAATLVEAGNLLMLESRARDSKEWMAAAHRLSVAADTALKAVEARKADALFDAGGKIYNACKGCHDRYALFDQPDSAPNKNAK
jgi:hypothetical protein